MLFTAYFDESDTHGPNPHMIMAAFLGSARQWELFERKIRALRRRYGFTTLHSKDFRAGVGEFAGWSNTKCRQLVNELAAAIRDGLTEGVTAILPRKLYIDEYHSPPVPIKMRLDSQYGVCFRICLHHLLNRLTTEKKSHKLHIVIESGHKNVRDTVRIFEELKAEYDANGIHILGDIKIANKSERLPLMVADFQAHASHLSEARVRAGLPGYFDLVKEQPNRGQAGLTQIEITAGSLHGLKIAWEEAKQERIEKWRAERIASGTLLTLVTQPNWRET